MDIYLLPTFDPCTNLATEEYLLTNRKEDILLLWRNDNTIVVGRNQNTSAEINARFVEERHIHVVRRITGGGAVYHLRHFIERSAKFSAETGSEKSVNYYLRAADELFRF